MSNLKDFHLNKCLLIHNSSLNEVTLIKLLTEKSPCIWSVDDFGVCGWLLNWIFKLFHIIWHFIKLLSSFIIWKNTFKIIFWYHNEHYLGICYIIKLCYISKPHKGAFNYLLIWFTKKRLWEKIERWKISTRENQRKMKMERVVRDRNEASNTENRGEICFVTSLWGSSTLSQLFVILQRASL